MTYYVNEGFEGAMVKNTEGFYKRGYRSSDIQKCKPFTDEEFTIIGYKEGKGKYKGCVIWQCTTDNGDSFYVDPMGSNAMNAQYLEDAHKYIGKPLTVKFQGKTKRGIPRFPVGKAIRTTN